MIASTRQTVKCEKEGPFINQVKRGTTFFSKFTELLVSQITYYKTLLKDLQNKCLIKSLWAVQTRQNRKV